MIINDKHTIINNKKLIDNNKNGLQNQIYKSSIVKNTNQMNIMIEQLKSSNKLKLYHNFKIVDQKKIINNIAVIQCFYGLDLNRIYATCKAISIMLQSNPFPEEWIFIESQTNSKKAVFKWLENFGVKYIFKKYSIESDGLLLKTALWNIGVKESVVDNFCFIDSDIVFCNQEWLNSVSIAFQNYDVLSLAGYVYYEDNEKRNQIIESIGHSIQNSNQTIFTGHIGFNIGMTRQAYFKYGKFEAFNLHDDSWIWTKILGTKNKHEKIGWIPYKTTLNMKYGLPLKVGSTEEYCCHINHYDLKSDKYEIYGSISYYLTKYPFEDIQYDLNNIDILPIWSKNKCGTIIKNIFKQIDDIKITNILEKKKIINDLIINSLDIIDTGINDDNPLIFITAVTKTFKNKSYLDIINHKKKIEKYCHQNFEYICITDDFTTINGNDVNLNIIPFSNQYVKDNRQSWINECTRKDLELPKNSTIVYIDFEEDIIDHDFIVLKNKHITKFTNDYIVK